MPLIDKKISELDPASALELLMTSELAIAPLGHPQTLRVSLELIQNLIGGERVFMAATDPVLETGRENDNWLNTDIGSFWKKQNGNWVKKYQFTPGTGGSSNIDQSFETILYAASRSVAYNPLRPKKKITLTGDIQVTNTGTVNGSQGIYLLVQDNTGNHSAYINGATIDINPGANQSTIIGWMFDGTGYHYSTNYSRNAFIMAVSNDIENTLQLI